MSPVQLSLWWLLPVFTGTVIVGKRWPPPRWFIANSAPPGEAFVVAQSNQVVAQSNPVIAPI